MDIVQLINALFEPITKWLDRLGAKLFACIAGLGLLGYLVIAGFLAPLGITIGLAVIVGIVAIVVIFYFARLKEKNGTNGGTTPTIPPNPLI